MDKRGVAELALLSDKIRARGKGKGIDYIIGLSGGLDSLYATYIAKEKWDCVLCSSMLSQDGIQNKPLGILKNW
jgi:tRNA(Ile)-lysidine synthase TilS/MesJ